MNDAARVLGFPVGFALIVVGQAIVCLVSRNASIAPVVAAAVLVYAGVGLVMSPMQTAGLKHLPPALNPFGVAIMNTFIQVAASFGPSLRRPQALQARGLQPHSHRRRASRLRCSWRL